GPKTRQLLLLHVGGPERLRAVSDAELLAIAGVSARHVRALRGHFAGLAAEGRARAEAPGGTARDAAGAEGVSTGDAPRSSEGVGVTASSEAVSEAPDAPG
ncbi:MAG: hypothetical protein ABI895_38315, partial [Deltaproteobacteria bacterium]